MMDGPVIDNMSIYRNLHIVMKMISFFIIFKFVNAVPPSFKREFLNELHTSLLPYKKRLAFYYMRSFERVIALNNEISIRKSPDQVDRM
jgi:hypothetical protein